MTPTPDIGDVLAISMGVCAIVYFICLHLKD